MTAESMTGDGYTVEVALASFMKAQRAAEDVITRCETLAGTSDDLRSSAHQMADILRGSAATLDAMQSAGSDLHARMRNTLEVLNTIELAVQSIDRSTAELAAHLVREVVASLDDSLPAAIGRLEETTRSAVGRAFSELAGSMDSQRDHLQQAQIELAEGLATAVATVRGELTPDVPPRLRWAGFGQVLSMLVFAVSGLGWIVFHLRGGDRYAFALEGDRNVAASIAIVVLSLALAGFTISLVALLRKEARPWLSIMAAVLAVAAALIAGHIGLSIFDGGVD